VRQLGLGVRALTLGSKTHADDTGDFAAPTGSKRFIKTFPELLCSPHRRHGCACILELLSFEGRNTIHSTVPRRSLRCQTLPCGGCGSICGLDCCLVAVVHFLRLTMLLVHGGAQKHYCIAIGINDDRGFFDGFSFPSFSHRQPPWRGMPDAA